MGSVTTEPTLSQHEIRIDAIAETIAGLEDRLEIERERRDGLIVEAVDQGVPIQRVRKAARFKADTRVRQILGGG